MRGDFEAQQTFITYIIVVIESKVHHIISYNINVKLYIQKEKTCLKICFVLLSDLFQQVLAKSYPTWIFLRADILQLPSLAKRWCVTRVPTYIFFWQGVEDL